MTKKERNKKRSVVNRFRAVLPAKGCNEAFCRSIAASFLAQCDPTVEEIADVKTVVSEAVTNCTVHAYRELPPSERAKKQICFSCELYSDGEFRFTVRDTGCGIADIERAMTPLYTTDSAGERSGMGLPIMQSFSDSFRIRSAPGKGTTVVFTKKIARAENENGNT